MLGYFAINHHALLSTISLPALETVNGTLGIDANLILTSISVPKLAHVALLSNYQLTLSFAKQ